MEYFKLNNGDTIPALGIGTFMLSPAEAEQSVRAALDMGYRLVDTASIYMNEKAVGRAIKGSGVDRGEIFLTTKLWPSDFKNAAEAIDASLRRLDTPYVDLLLIHRPYGNFHDAWKAMERAVVDGKVKSIGVSNFSDKQLNKLLSYAEIKPSVLQSECHPYYSRDDQRNKFAQDGIRIEAWYPLGHGNAKLIGQPVFTELAQKYGKSNVQVILRWHVQKGNVVIPGSKNPEHIKSNFDIFDFALTDEEMAEIAKLDKGRLLYHGPEWISAIFAPHAKIDFDSQE